MIDSHCHLDDKQFAADREEVIARALAAGVSRMLAIGTGDGPPDLETAVRLADRYPFLYATIGVHPHDASKATQQTYDDLRRLASHSKVLAVGEIGLDYHYDFSPRDVQREVFATQLAIASEAGLPIVIHTREAWEDTLEILKASWKGQGIMHCFTGDVAMARQALDQNFHLAFGGVITFPKAETTRDAARLCPADRVLLETDCPYLAPVPHRGKRNEPAYMLDTANYLAKLRSTDVERLAVETTANFDRLFIAQSPS